MPAASSSAEIRPCTQSSVAPRSQASAAIAPTSSSVNVPGSPVGADRSPLEVRLRFTTRLTASPTVYRRTSSAVAVSASRSSPVARSSAAHSASSSASGSAAARSPSRARSPAARESARCVCSEGVIWRARGDLASGVAAASPVAGSARAETAGHSAGSIQVSACWTNSGCAVSRSRSSKPSSAVRVARSVRCGHGRSGFTWSAVSGETPPQSSAPARSSSSNSAGSERFGGTCTRMCGPITSRATATAATYSSTDASGASCIAVRGFARKFWTMTSCT